jgi:hypothetical protein
MTALPKASTVCLHGTMADDEGNPAATYADPHEATGWCVYTRTDFEESGKPHPAGFDISDEMDFESRAEALAEAETRAKRLGVRVFEY